MNNLKNLFFHNFMQYDFIIFILYGITILILCLLSGNIKKLKSMLKLDISANEPNPHAVMKKFIEESGKITKIENLRDRQNLYYSLFVNAIAIFPLLGMLGTVISLLQLASDSDNLIGNFYGALTSTLWGLIFAVIFKAVDAFVSAKVEANEKAVTFRLQKFLEPEQEKKSRIRKKSENPENPEKNKELQELGI